MVDVGEIEGEDSFRGRLASLIGPDSVRGFARLTGVGSTTLQKYLDGAMPGLENLAQICEVTGVSMDWLATGRVPKMRLYPQMYPENQVDLLAEFAFVPRFDVRASAGSGALTIHEDEVERIAFRQEWLREIGVDPNEAGLLTAAGDSMSPTIPDGALMLVDRRKDQQLRSGYVYIIVLDGEVLVKRLSRNVDKTIDLISDNPLYPVKTIRQVDFDGLFIAGRVFWVGRKL